MTRGFLKSNVEKELSKEKVIIFDSLNYIKGYRYEMYCLARAVKTTNCVVQLKLSLDF
jgi:protein KTI12